MTFLASLGDPCQMDINYLLGVVDLHKEEVHADVPTSGGDQDCLSGNGGIDPEDPGSGPWSQPWIYYDGEVFKLKEWQDFVDPGNEEPPVDVEELLEDKQPAENQSGNSGNSNGGGPPEPFKEENPWGSVDPSRWIPVVHTSGPPVFVHEYGRRPTPSRSVGRPLFSQSRPFGVRPEIAHRTNSRAFQQL